jgi:hypothetical protein
MAQRMPRRGLLIQAQPSTEFSDFFLLALNTTLAVLSLCRHHRLLLTGRHHPSPLRLLGHHHAPTHHSQRAPSPPLRDHQAVLLTHHHHQHHHCYLQLYTHHHHGRMIVDVVGTGHRRRLYPTPLALESPEFVSLASTLRLTATSLSVQPRRSCQCSRMAGRPTRVALVSWSRGRMNSTSMAWRSCTVPALKRLLRLTGLGVRPRGRLTFQER